MTTVYSVTCGEYGDYQVVAVFSTALGAERFRQRRIKTAQERGGLVRDTDYLIEERTMDEDEGDEAQP